MSASNKQPKQYVCGADTIVDLILNSFVGTRTFKLDAADAEELLKLNWPHNRARGDGKIEKIARVLRAGDWVHNGESIKFSDTGYLIDGQTRLKAVLATGIPIVTDVAFGILESAFSTLDQQDNRSASDVLSINGVENYKIVAPAAVALYRMLKNQPIHGGLTSLPPVVVVDIVERHPDLVKAASYVRSRRGKEHVVVSPAYTATFYYLLKHIMHQSGLATSFVDNVFSGANLVVGDPMLSFRNRIMDAKVRREVPNTQAKIALLAKVVGMKIEGKLVKSQLRQPETTERWFSLIPGLEQAVRNIPPRQRLLDLEY